MDIAKACLRNITQTCPCNKQDIFKVVKKMIIFSRNVLIFLLIFAQNIDCGYTLEAVLTSTQNLCFEAKIRKIDIPLQTPVFFLYLKVGFMGINFSWTCFPDEAGE